MTDYFQDVQWTDDTFWPWLAGYFERGGRIPMPPEKVTVYLSLWAKTKGSCKRFTRT